MTGARPPRVHGQRPLQTPSAVSRGGQGMEGIRGQDTPARFSAPNPSGTKQALRSQVAPCGSQLSIEGATTLPGAEPAPHASFTPQISAPHLCPEHCPQLPRPTSQAPRFGAAPLFQENRSVGLDSLSALPSPTTPASAPPAPQPIPASGQEPRRRARDPQRAGCSRARGPARPRHRRERRQADGRSAIVLQGAAGSDQTEQGRAQSHSPSPSGGSSRGASRSRKWKLAIMSRTASISLFRPWLWFRPSAAPSSGLSPCGNEAHLSRASPGTRAQPPSSPGAHVRVSDRPGCQRGPWPHRGEGALVCLGWRGAHAAAVLGVHRGRHPAPGQPTHLCVVIWQQGPEEEGDCVSVADGTQPEREGQRGQEARKGGNGEPRAGPAL